MLATYVESNNQEQQYPLDSEDFPRWTINLVGRNVPKKGKRLNPPYNTTKVTWTFQAVCTITGVEIWERERLHENKIFARPITCIPDDSLQVTYDWKS